MTAHPESATLPTFSFDDLNSESHASNGAASGPKSVARAKYRVLIVEDDISTSRLIAANLHKAGLEFQCVPNGEVALKAFEEDPPHLVLLDLILPGINGFEVCRTIRTQSQVPVIMMTSRVETTHQVRSFRLGADDYVIKPFDPQLLVARIIAHLRRVYRYDHTSPQFKSASELNAAAHPAKVLPQANTRQGSTIPDGWAGCGSCSYMGPLEKFPQRSNGYGQNVLTCPHCGIEKSVQFLVN